MVHNLVAALVAASAVAATSGKATWEADYGKALAATRSDQRPLLVVLDIPSNPQASLDEQLTSAEGEQAKLLESYELCRVDVSTEYGRRVAQAFGATQFPHTAIIDRTGAIVLYKKLGKMGENEWTSTLAKFQSGDRSLAETRTAYYRGYSILPSSYPVMYNSSYCPSCQRRPMGL